jgi:hypothetical protein
MTMHSYETDVIAWANEQAAFIRAGRFDLLDIEHIADEIEDVGKSEKRELESRMALLLAHLLKWQFQVGYRSNSWARTIKEQRRGIDGRLKQTPSLKNELSQDIWWEWIWSDAVTIAVKETGLDCFPDSCPWGFEQIINPEFWPD